ncbi:hypothetical protein SETIT_1G328800v2 [Setaria italica]|uniref:Uncharacterized protein n=2 Tax=Setaria italica TaxID=4555 RepID=A0A368PS62_SETIT|nr:uncharacterized protein LOC101767636 [Setaria italica]RCV08463.1 hypothetical protein SETIT_1G328800v2 [Setaria italica]
MELITPPPQEFLVGSSAAGPYTPKSAIMNPFAAASGDDSAAGNPFLATAVTAPPSPNPFDHLPPGASDADPFDLFQHFTSAPASPARAAAIYAQFDSVDDGGAGGKFDGDAAFQPRVSYSTVASTVPFGWEEKPGKPKPEFAVAAAATVEGAEVDDADFDFGVLLDKAAQALELTTADELFDEGKIRPLKPPPRLLEGGSVGSSPRSARSVMWSPRLRRSVVRPGGDDFDPFAAALAKAANAPSPLGAGSKDDSTGVEPATSPENPADSATTATSTTPPTTSNGRRKKWRLSDLLLFRRVAGKGRAAGNISRDPVFKYPPVQQLGTPAKTASAGPAAAEGDVSSGRHRKQSKKSAPEGGMPMPHRQSMMGCVRLHPGLHRLAKGFHGHSVHLGGRGTARSAMKG